jgi:hypothetical protein
MRSNTAGLRHRSVAPHPDSSSALAVSETSGPSEMAGDAKDSSNKRGRRKTVPSVTKSGLRCCSRYCKKGQQRHDLTSV